MKKLSILILPVVIFLIATFASIWKLQEDFSHDPNEVRGTSLWIATEVNREYWRFLEALGRFSHGDDTIDKDELLLRRDIFWAQLNNYQSGNLGKHLSEVSQGKDIVANVDRLLTETEQQIDSLVSGDNQAGHALRTRFIEYANQVNQMTQRIDKAENEYFVDVFNRTEEALYTLSILIAAMAITGSILLVMLFVSVKRANKLQQAAEQAENQVRELNESLEQRIQERTKSLEETMGRLEDAQTIAQIGDFTWDLTTGNVTWSDNMYRLVKYDPHSDIDINLVNKEIHHPDDLPWVTEWLNEGIQACTPLLEPKQYRCICSDGEVIWIQCRARIEVVDGEASVMFGTVQDITDAKLKSEQLRRTQKMDALGKLTGGIAHDYNNVLAVIIGYVDLLGNELKDNNKLSKYISEVRHAAERAAKLSNKLLGFSRKKPAENIQLSLNDVLNDIQLMLQKTLTVRIDLNYELDDELSNILIDSNDLEDAILNITINAMHAIEGTGKVSFETKNIELSDFDAKTLGLEPGSYVTLSISDTGCGMTDEIKERIFEPFFTTKEEKGTGLGLSQVYGLVQRTQGAIKVYSEVDIGTRIILYFPAINPSAISEDLSTSDAIQNFDGNETILVVDDEVSILELADAIITPYGYRVITSDNAEYALSIMAEQSIDMVISDIIMPKMDGYELAKNIQDKFPQVKILLASGFNDLEHVSDIDDALIDNMIHKPFSSEELMRKIRGLLDQ